MRKFLKWLDSQVPDPWIIEDLVQSRPSTQLGFILGVIITLIIYSLI